MGECLVTRDLAMALPDSPRATEFVDAKGSRVPLHQRLRHDAVATEEGHEEGEWANEERRVLEESLTFAQVLVDQSKLALL